MQALCVNSVVTLLQDDPRAERKYLNIFVISVREKLPQVSWKFKFPAVFVRLCHVVLPFFIVHLPSCAYIPGNESIVLDYSVHL